MSIEENKRIAEQDVLYVGPKTVDKKLGYYAEDAVVWDSVMRVLGYSGSNTASGFEEVKKFFTWLANLPPVRVEIQNIFGEGEKVAVEWLLRGEGKDGPFTIPCVNIYDFENGKIKGVRMQFDSAAFAEIVGKQ